MAQTIPGTSGAGGYCFTSGVSVCGNGIVEYGEQCDCGSTSSQARQFASVTAGLTCLVGVLNGRPLLQPQLHAEGRRAVQA